VIQITKSPSREIPNPKSQIPKPRNAKPKTSNPQPKTKKWKIKKALEICPSRKS
jgi:hypothetical protein